MKPHRTANSYSKPLQHNLLQLTNNITENIGNISLDTSDWSSTEKQWYRLKRAIGWSLKKVYDGYIMKTLSQILLRSHLQDWKSSVQTIASIYLHVKISRRESWLVVVMQRDIIQLKMLNLKLKQWFISHAIAWLWFNFWNIYRTGMLIYLSAR